MIPTITQFSDPNELPKLANNSENKTEKQAFRMQNLQTKVKVKNIMKKKLETCEKNVPKPA